MPITCITALWLLLAALKTPACMHIPVVPVWLLGEGLVPGVAGAVCGTGAGKKTRAAQPAADPGHSADFYDVTVGTHHVRCFIDACFI